jgi:methylthioribulose-1-phosphate dehydratase
VFSSIGGVVESGATVQLFRHSDALAAGLVDESPETLIPELCRQFYHLGWVTGTGGGISIRSGDLYFIAPSGVQKERIRAEDLFVLDKQRNVLRKPTNPDYRPSACTPLFFNAYDLYDSGACIHTHSMWANLVTRLYDREFRITKQEMIKGIQGHGYLDELVIPIIDNTPSEADLRDSMRAAMLAYPRATAILVRNHGMYCYGHTWKDAKTQCECYDYLFEYAVKVAQLQLPAPKHE